MDGTSIPPELIGHAALTVAFVLVAWALLREAAKWTIRIALVFGVLLGGAVLVGLLDNTAAGSILYWVGANIAHGVEVVASLMAEAWQQMMGIEETAA